MYAITYAFRNAALYAIGCAAIRCASRHATVYTIMYYERVFRRAFRLSHAAHVKFNQRRRSTRRCQLYDLPALLVALPTIKSSHI